MSIPHIGERAGILLLPKNRVIEKSAGAAQHDFLGVGD